MLMGRGVFAANTTPADVITLSGTTGSPNLAVDDVVDPDDATVTWELRANGELFHANSFTESRLGSEWNSNTPAAATYWGRFTSYSGTAPNVGSTLNTWHELGTSLRYTGWTRTSIGTTSGVAKIEIATDSGGSTIVATGYYSGQATVEP